MSQNQLLQTSVTFIGWLGGELESTASVLSHNHLARTNVGYEKRPIGFIVKDQTKLVSLD